MVGYNYITPKHFPPTPTQALGFTLAWVTGSYFPRERGQDKGMVSRSYIRVIKVSAWGWHGDGLGYGVSYGVAL